MKKMGKSKLTQALLETANGMRRAGVLSEAAHAKITKRHLGTAEAATVTPLAPSESAVSVKTQK